MIKEKEIIENLYLNIRDEVIKEIKSRYVDIPKIFHNFVGDGTSSDLVIDEIAYLAIKKAKQEKDKEIAVITSEWNDTLNEAVKKARQEAYNQGYADGLAKKYNEEMQMVNVNICAWCGMKHTGSKRLAGKSICEECMENQED